MSFIQYSIHNSVATILLNKPEKFNSFCRQMALDMQAALQDCSSNPAVRAVMITGSGKAFCAGQDLAEATSDAFPGFTKVVSEHYNPIILAMRNMPKPIVVAVNGVAAGAGANIALAGDIVVAHAKASFVQAFSKIALVPDSGGTFFLPRLVGMQRAAALTMLADNITATEALQMGMLYKVYEQEGYDESVSELVSRVATMPTQALALTKQLLNESWSNTLEQQLARECQLQTEAGNDPNYKEGVAAFLEKRKPVFE